VVSSSLLTYWPISRLYFLPLIAVEVRWRNFRKEWKTGSAGKWPATVMAVPRPSFPPLPETGIVPNYFTTCLRNRQSKHGFSLTRQSGRHRRVDFRLIALGGATTPRNNDVTRVHNVGANLITHLYPCTTVTQSSRAIPITRLESLFKPDPWQITVQTYRSTLFFM
jgi:hypothetical protein